MLDVDLIVSAGEVVAFAGPSGAGKTTLIRLLNGTLKPTSGRVLVEGEELTTLSSRQLRRVRGRIGTVHQNLGLIPNLRVIKNVLVGRLGRWSLLSSLRMMCFPPRREVEEVYRLLEMVGIGDKLWQRIGSLSGGELQRVAVARALFQEPVALLADEPVSSVDPARARATVALLVDVARKARLTLCMSLHNIELAQEFLPRLLGLRRGRLLFDRPTSEVDAADLRELYDLRGESSC